MEWTVSPVGSRLRAEYPQASLAKDRLDLIGPLGSLEEEFITSSDWRGHTNMRANDITFYDIGSVPHYLISVDDHFLLG